MTKRKRRINKRKLRELRACDAEIKRYADELRRSKVPESGIKAAAEMMMLLFGAKRR